MNFIPLSLVIVSLFILLGVMQGWAAMFGVIGMFAFVAIFFYTVYIAMRGHV